MTTISYIKRFFYLILMMLGASFPLQFLTAAPILPPLNNPATDKHLTGKFVWFDLATDNLENQKTFYGKVFGWKFRSIGDSDDKYTLIINGTSNVAGMFSVKPREGAPVGALWIGLMSVNDPAEAMTKVKAAGGAIHTQPTTMANRGTYALIRDPEGALFGVMKSDSGDPVDKPTDIGDFLWVDLFADQPEKLGQFYRQLAGYDISQDEAKEGVERLILTSQGKYRAGIVPLPKDANRAGWLPYVRVEDVNGTLKKVTEAGGIVMVAPDKDLLDGNLAIFSDPQGGVLGIVKWGDTVAGKE